MSGEVNQEVMDMSKEKGGFGVEGLTPPYQFERRAREVGIRRSCSFLLIRSEGTRRTINGWVPAHNCETSERGTMSKKERSAMRERVMIFLSLSTGSTSNISQGDMLTSRRAYALC